MANMADRNALIHRMDVCRLLERQLDVFDTLVAQKLLLANRRERLAFEENEKATYSKDAS